MAPRIPPAAPPITAPLTLFRLVVAPMTAPAAAPIAASRFVFFCVTVGAEAGAALPLELVPELLLRVLVERCVVDVVRRGAAVVAVLVAEFDGTFVYPR